MLSKLYTQIASVHRESLYYAYAQYSIDVTLLIGAEMVVYESDSYDTFFSSLFNELYSLIDSGKDVKLIKSDYIR